MSEKLNRTLPWRILEDTYRPKIRFWIPASAVDEADLRLEIQNLCARGFGSVEVVVLSTLPKEIAFSEYGWGSDQWDKTLAIIADETKKCGMTMDIAIGPGWPIASPEINSAEDLAVLCELTYGEVDVAAGTIYDGRIPERKQKRPEGVPTLIHVMAYQTVGEKVLSKESYMDLSSFIEDNHICCELPMGNGQSWKIFSFYQQPACQKINADQDYVVDHLSVAGAKACEKYWDKVFEKYDFESMESFFCDSLEYQVTLEWTPMLLEEFVNRRGYDLRPYLPFLGLSNTFPQGDIPGYVMDDKTISDMINRDYLETITQCYCENHLSYLEGYAKAHGKNVRYQVAYNKPFEVERCGLYVGIPENEALGRPSMEYMKTMTAAAHLGRKPRHTFECAAEFMHSYGQDYEDLFWWIKRSLMSGMNGQVLHGASYSGGYHGRLSENGQIPGVHWPGYEGFGKMVSNNWNRTLSVEHARGCIDAAGRLNTVFSQCAKVDCAVFKDTYSSDGLGGDHDLYPDGGALIRRGYSWEFVSQALLDLNVCQVTQNENGYVLDSEGPSYKCLIVPETSYASLAFIMKALQLLNQNFTIIWQGKRPTVEKFFSGWQSEEQKGIWRESMETLWHHERMIHVEDLKEVPDVLMAHGILPDVLLDDSMPITTAVRKDMNSSNTYYVLYGYNEVIYAPDEKDTQDGGPGNVFKKGTIKESYVRPGLVSERKVHVKLKGCGNIYVCNYWNGTMSSIKFVYDGHGFMEGDIRIQEDEMIIFCLIPSGVIYDNLKKTQSVQREQILEYPVCFNTLNFYSFEPNEKDEVSFLRSGFQTESTTVVLTGSKLKPWKDMDSKWMHFSGKGVYEGTIEVGCLEEHMQFILELGDVCDTFSVEINGQETSYPDQVLKRVDVTEFIRLGTNTVRVSVVSNLYNRLYHEGMTYWGTSLPYHPRNYGIWETEHKKIRLVGNICI